MKEIKKSASFFANDKQSNGTVKKTKFNIDLNYSPEYDSFIIRVKAGEGIMSYTSSIERMPLEVIQKLNEMLEDILIKAHSKTEINENLEVELEAMPNPDFSRSSHEGSIKIKSHRVKVKSLQEAIAVVRNFISDNDLGGGNFTGGDLFSHGKKIGMVSYNGRVWDLNDNPLKFKRGGALVGNQYKIDLNKNGKIDAEDFKLLRSSMNGAWRNERKHVNHAQDYEVRYARNKPARTGYKGKRNFAGGGGVESNIKKGDLFVINAINDRSNTPNEYTPQVFIITGIKDNKLAIAYNGSKKGLIEQSYLLKKKKYSLSEILKEFRKSYDMQISSRLHSIIEELPKEIITKKTIELLKKEFPNQKFRINGGNMNQETKDDCYSLTLVPPNQVWKDVWIHKVDGHYIVHQMGFKINSNYYYVFDSIEDLIKNRHHIYLNGGETDSFTNEHGIKVKSVFKPAKKPTKAEWLAKHNKSNEATVMFLGGAFKNRMNRNAFPNIEQKQVMTKSGEYVQVFNQVDDIVYVTPLNQIGTGVRPVKMNISELDEKTFKYGGGISNFEKLSNSVARNYVGKRVKPKYQRLYGKTYSAEEAKEVGNKVAGKMRLMKKS